MTNVAVVAHTAKTLGDGLPDLRRRLSDSGVTDPIWREVSSLDDVSGAAENALASGADVLLVWGGDGTVQQAVDAVAGSGVCVGILPAGTANLFATNLGIPHDLGGALDVALHGARRTLDLGVVNGERFAVMAGAGFDAAMIERADGQLKKRLGRLAYAWTGLRATAQAARPVTIALDGAPWFEGRASCVLLGSFGSIAGGLVAFPAASPTDGLLDVGVVTAEGSWQWARVMARVAVGSPGASPFTRMAQAETVTVQFADDTEYELDGSGRDACRRLVAGVDRGGVLVAAPEEAAS